MVTPHAPNHHRTQHSPSSPPCPLPHLPVHPLPHNHTQIPLQVSFGRPLGNACIDYYAVALSDTNATGAAPQSQTVGPDQFTLATFDGLTPGHVYAATVSSQGCATGGGGRGVMLEACMGCWP